MHDKEKLSKINLALKSIKDPTIREKLLMIKEYYQVKSLRTVAEKHQCSHMKVRYWLKRYQKEEESGLKVKDRPGAPSKLAKDKAREIRKQIISQISTKGGWQTKQIREYIKEESGIVYSIRHVIRIAQNWGLSKITPRPQYLYAKKRDKQVFLKEKYQIPSPTRI